MSIDDRARSAGARLRSDASVDADLDAGLQELLVTVRRRQRLRLIGVTAVVGLVVAGVTLGLSHDLQPVKPAPPAAQRSPTVSSHSGICTLAYFTCTGGRIDVKMAAPFAWTPPRFFDRNLHWAPNARQTQLLLVESYRSDPGVSGGVTVLENVEPLKNTGLTHADVAAGSGARALATWLSQRSFLNTTQPRQTTVDGLTAWTVQAQLGLPRQQGPALCNDRFLCAPLFAARHSEGAFIGIWSDLIGRYTFVDVPGAGTTVIWSWTFGDSAALAGNQPLINSIRFTAG